MDFYRRIPKDLTESSVPGGTLSIVAAAFMICLLFLEFFSFYSGSLMTTVTVDRNDSPWLRVDFDVSLPEVTCDHTSVDVMDSLGTRLMDLHKNVEKTGLDTNGVPIGKYDDLHKTPAGNAPRGHVARHEEERAKNQPIDRYEIGSDIFEKYLEEHEWVFVNFGASWCSHCQNLAPIWQSAHTVMAQRGSIVKMPHVECTQNMPLCVAQRVQAFPTMIMYHKGKFHSVYRGKRDVNALVHHAESVIDAGALPSPSTAAVPHNKAAKPAKNVRADHGCKIVGHLLVRRVPGTIQFSVKSPEHNFSVRNLNFSHQVNHLSFHSSDNIPESVEVGALTNRKVRKLLESGHDVGYYNPADNPIYKKKFISEDVHAVHEHYIKVVFTSIKFLGRDSIPTYQHSVSSHSYVSDALPVVKLGYDLSPMQVIVSEERRPWYNFVTSLCAIIGGTFTVMGILTSVVHGSIAKRVLGKDT